MNELLNWFAGGDLRSDGMALEVAELVLQNPALLGDLMAGLSSPVDVVQGRTADSLEKVSRLRSDLILGYFDQLVAVTVSDSVPMVKVHLAMIFGNLSVYKARIKDISEVLLRLLEDQSVFVRSWAISSLCIVGRKYPDRKAPILEQIERQRKDKSIAICTQVDKAMRLLMDDRAPFPKGWLKSAELLKELD